MWHRLQILVRMGEHVGVVMNDPPMQDVPDIRCWLCGGQTGGRGAPVKKVIQNTFTDRDKARYPMSGSVCPGAISTTFLMSC